MKQKTGKFDSPSESPPSRKAVDPRTVLIGFLVVLAVVALAAYLRHRPSTGSGPATSDAGQETVQTAPDRRALRETRKEGTVYECTVVGMLEGTMKQTTSLEAFHPIFKGDIRSAWIAPWTTRFTAEIVRNDGDTIEERRTFEEVRSVELMAPAELTDLTYDLDPDVNRVITELAARLQVFFPGSPVSQGAGVLIKSQDFDYAEVARLTGIDRLLLSSQQTAVTGAARILDDFEGKTFEVQLKDGRAQWIYAPDVPPQAAEAMGRVGALIDYSALPSPELAVGESTVITELLINELMPPEILTELLGDFDTDLTLRLVRMPDESIDGRTLSRFDGEGTLRLMQADGNVHARLQVEQASLRIDETDPHNRFLHVFEITTPIETQVLQRNSRFKNVAWDGDLNLRLTYQVERRK